MDPLTYTAKEGDNVRIRRGKTIWTVKAVAADGQTAFLTNGKRSTWEYVERLNLVRSA